MMNSVDGENTLDKIKQLFMTKFHSRLRIKGHALSLIKEHLHKPSANIIFSDNMLNEFP